MLLIDHCVYQFINGILHTELGLLDQVIFIDKSSPSLGD